MGESAERLSILTPDNVHLSGVRMAGSVNEATCDTEYFVSCEYVNCDETNATILRCPTSVTTRAVPDRSRVAGDLAVPRNTVTIQTTRDGALGGNVNGYKRSRRHRPVLSL
ncbi:hypothetical protein GCM10009764_57650 [Nocardia ninae]|uniref:Uncharacterized protein n=1 Tax=Nocardia ninae NBRC 108245 TaxID=1210091 RepID=A0A511M4L0_9NOCA|nr:hypothetical protein NN4_01010 [Nocardia ninae NBRC 108245]